MTEIEQVIGLLAECFPKCFVVEERQRRPIKLGVHRDIIAALDTMTGERINRSRVNRALRYYVGNSFYLKTVRAGVPRIDLKGRRAGTVRKADERHARSRLAARALWL